MPMLHIYPGPYSASLCAGRSSPAAETASSGRTPGMDGDVPGIHAADGEGEYDIAFSLRDQAFEPLPQAPGTSTGNLSNGLQMRIPALGPVIEVILNAKYYWVPFQQIRAITIPEPRDLRDKVWLPAAVHLDKRRPGPRPDPGPLCGFGELRGPADSTRAKDGMDRELADGVHRGLGQRMLATDQDEYALMDIREIHCH